MRFKKMGTFFYLLSHYLRVHEINFGKFAGGLGTYLSRYLDQETAK